MNIIMNTFLLYEFIYKFMDYCSYNTIRVFNFEGLKFCGPSKWLHIFEGPCNLYSLCSDVMFSFMDSKQP